jgi:hypothetical protein
MQATHQGSGALQLRLPGFDVEIDPALIAALECAARTMHTPPASVADSEWWAELAVADGEGISRLNYVAARVSGASAEAILEVASEGYDVGYYADGRQLGFDHVHAKAWASYCAQYGADG